MMIKKRLFMPEHTFPFFYKPMWKNEKIMLLYVNVSDQETMGFLGKFTLSQG